jgi:recombination protein RecA
MPTAQHLRAQIEANLAKRIPSALTPSPKIAYAVAPTGIREIDELLHGGFPIGALSEIVGPECSGRTSLALTLVANLTQAGKVCAWVDVSDTFHPESAASIGVDLTRLLWIRCGRSVSASLPDVSVRGLHTEEKPLKRKPGLPHSGGSHPRMEANGLSDAVSNLLTVAPRCAEAQPNTRPRSLSNQSHQTGLHLTPFPSPQMKSAPKRKSWSRLEQGLRVSDLLLQAGGFSCIVLDMGSLNAEYVLRVPLATWFRFRAAAERLQSNVLLLTQHACSRNSAGLVLRLDPGNVLGKDGTIFTGLEHRAGLARQRFAQGNVLPLRKQPQSVHTAQWQVKSVWAGQR